MNKDFTQEVKITTSRSSGPGGQNVNKVNTKVQISLNITASNILTNNEKEVLIKKLDNKINGDGNLIVVSQNNRSQIQNKEDAIKKLNSIINNALKVKKKRYRTKPPKSANENRLKKKQDVSDKKKLRKNPK